MCYVTNHQYNSLRSAHSILGNAKTSMDRMCGTATGPSVRSSRVALNDIEPINSQCYIIASADAVGDTSLGLVFILRKGGKRD